MNDQQIIELLWQRSEEALGALSVRCRRMCIGIAVGILGNREDAEECFNDALHRVWNAVPPDKPENLPAYVAKITRNICLNRIDMARAAKRGGGRYSAVYEELEECISSSEDVEGRVTDRIAVKNAYERFLASLDNEQKELFLRRYFLFEEVAAIASSMHMKESALRMRLMRLRMKLKEYLKQENVEI